MSTNRREGLEKREIYFGAFVFYYLLEDDDRIDLQNIL